jgi:hypothetical protein
MKNIKKLKLFGLAFALCGLALVASCSKDDDNNTDDNGNGTVTLAAPTGLTVGEVTQTTAHLSWSASEGASSYELKVDENASLTLTSGSYTVTDLNPATTYTWQVRAKSAETYSEWVSGANFVTAAPPVQKGGQITFGSTTWTAKAFGGYYDIGYDRHLAIELYRHNVWDWEDESSLSYPTVMVDVFEINVNSPREYNSVNNRPNYDYFVEYYNEGYYNLGPYYGYPDGEIVVGGDYTLDPGSPSAINITAFDGTKVSGTVNLTLMEAAPYYDNEAYIITGRTPLIITFNDVPVGDYATAEAGSAAAKAATSALTLGKLKMLKARR